MSRRSTVENQAELGLALDLDALRVARIRRLAHAALDQGDNQAYFALRRRWARALISSLASQNRRP